MLLGFFGKDWLAYHTWSTWAFTHKYAHTSNSVHFTAAKQLICFPQLSYPVMYRANVGVCVWQEEEYAWQRLAEAAQALLSTSADPELKAELLSRWQHFVDLSFAARPQALAPPVS